MNYRLRFACRFCAGVLMVVLISCFSITIFAASSDNDVKKNSEPVSLAAETAQENTDVHEVYDTLEAAAPVSDEKEVQTSVADETMEAQEVDSLETIKTGDSGYELTDYERMLVECAVMCESGGESVKGQMMVAQSILDGSLRNNYTVTQTIAKYKVATTAYFYVTDEVKESVARVFDNGERITEEKTDLWYNPAMVVSAWHEAQNYVITVGSHRFFWMTDDM